VIGAITCGTRLKWEREGDQVELTAMMRAAADVSGPVTIRLCQATAGRRGGLTAQMRELIAATHDVVRFTPST
jgi:hypothetical protein